MLGGFESSIYGKERSIRDFQVLDLGYRRPVSGRRAYEKIVIYLAICLGLRSYLSIRIFDICYGAIR